MQHALQLFKFGARFLPFASIEKSLCPLLLQFDSGIRIFLAKRFLQRGEGRARGFTFIGERIFVEKYLVILGGTSRLVSGLVRLRAQQQQSRF